MIIVCFGVFFRAFGAKKLSDKNTTYECQSEVRSIPCGNPCISTFRSLNRSIVKTIQSYEFIFYEQSGLCMNILENMFFDDDPDDFDRFRVDS